MIPRKRVLFLCVENSCRSQMAEGFLRAMAGERFEVTSAGNVATRVNPYAVRVMAEYGIDISDHRSKAISEYGEQAFDYVVTVYEDSPGGRCPVFRGEAAERLLWPIEDPAQANRDEQEVLTAFRHIRDQIKKRVERFAGNDATAELEAKRTGGNEK